MSKTSNGKPKTGGVTPRSAIYSIISGKRVLILDTVLELLTSRNESIRLGAVKVLINKLIPDLKSTEITGVDGADLKLEIRIIEDDTVKKKDEIRPKDKKL